MPEPAELRYRIVCYELEGEKQTVILDQVARGFMADTGTIDEAGTMHGAGTHAGPLPLRRRLTRALADDEQLASRLTLAARPGVRSRQRPSVRLPFPATGHAITERRPMSQHDPAHNLIIQIKIKLLGVSKPPVWRRVQLHADTRLDQLHEILQAALGWENYHLHAFSFGDEEFGPRDPDLALDFADERNVTLGELTDIGARFHYTYDFGDNWEHEILVEDLLDPDPSTHYPILVTAKGACPPEDCGGAWSYTDLKAILADPGDEQHQEMLEWLGLENGSEFDLNNTIDYQHALTVASR